MNEVFLGQKTLGIRRVLLYVSCIVRILRRATVARPSETVRVRFKSVERRAVSEGDQIFPSDELTSESNT